MSSGSQFPAVPSNQPPISLSSAIMTNTTSGQQIMYNPSGYNTGGAVNKRLHELSPEEVMDSVTNSIKRMLDDKIAEAQMLWEEEQDEGALGELVAYKKMKTDLLEELNKYPDRVFSVPRKMTSDYLAQRMYNYP